MSSTPPKGGVLFMKAIIEYTTKWLRFKKRYDIYIAQTWMELEESQVFDIMNIFMQRTNETIAVPALLKTLSALPDSCFFNISADQIVDHFYTAVTWVFSQPMISPPVPVLFLREQGRAHGYSMPSTAMRSSSFYEYIEAEKAFLAYIKNGDESELDLLCSILLRPITAHSKKYTFDLEIVTQRARTLKTQLSPVQKYYISYFFSWVRHHIAQKYFHFDPDKAQKKTRSVEKHDWHKTAMEIAEIKTFGNYTEVLYTNCHTIFKFLKKKEKPEENLTLKEKLEQNNKKFLG